MNKESRACPFCGEEILAIAKKCKHCREFLNKDNLLTSDNYQGQNRHEITYRSQNCSIAIASFILAMVSIFFGFTCIPAIICGHIALTQCNEDPSLQGRGYAVAALAISYVIAIIGIIVGLFWLGLAGFLWTS